MPSEHANSSKHLTELKKNLQFFLGGTRSLKRSIETFLTNAQTMEVEIIWVLKTVFSGFSNNLNNDISNCFRTIFPDNNTTFLVLSRMKWI